MSPLNQVKWEIIRQFRNRRFFIFTILIPLFYYFLFVKIDGGNMKVAGSAWKVYFMMSMATFSSIGAALNGLASRIAFERTQGWMTLIRTTPLRPVYYVVGKVGAQLLVSAVMVIVLFAAGALGEGVRLTTAQWVTSWLWLTIGTMPFIALGISIGLIAGMEASGMAATGIYLIFSILGGLWFPTAIMPKLLQHIATWTPTYRIANIAWRIGAHSAPRLSDIAVLAGYLVVFGALAQWAYRNRRETIA
ncbi:ABC transporter permease [Alicyclobacillus sp. ALC3]|uniref:ABC transporter permease n=1 Tax=Alicyclobacillus sp. ALC3 TaxID=2796143 RepID=UPI002379F133|nr:ABC transporter permease [Alicyclobacillus sp. ALC3]WDL95753.1 ABC transporter permease [Alicyclobacillus sp. ALC3]